MSEGIKKEIALVTGGGKGIGAACCRELSDQGYRVAVHYNSSRQEAEVLAAGLADAFTIKADLSNLEELETIYNRIKDEGGNLKVLVNNAGVAIDNPIFSATLEDFEKSFQTNLRATWYLTKRLSRFMIRNKSGRIINISSIIAHTGNPTQSAYGLTKAAIENFTKTAAQEFAQYGILVNSIAPGFIITDMTEKISQELKDQILSRIPLGRFGTPQEVGSIVGFLAGKATYCTGATFHVNGGMYCA